jgi:hypothetical protein
VTRETLRADLGQLVAAAPPEELPAVVGALVEAEERARVPPADLGGGVHGAARGAGS